MFFIRFDFSENSGDLYEKNWGDASNHDDDNDGPPDAIDNCPETALGAVVTSFGCTAQQIKDRGLSLLNPLIRIKNG